MEKEPCYSGDKIFNYPLYPYRFVGSLQNSFCHKDKECYNENENSHEDAAQDPPDMYFQEHGLLIVSLQGKISRESKEQVNQAVDQQAAFHYEFPGRGLFKNIYCKQH